MIKINYIELETRYPKIYFFNITDEIKARIAESGF